MLMRRIAIMTVGFSIAASVGAIFLIVSAFFDPTTREAGFSATMAGLFAIIDEALVGGAPESALIALTNIVWAIVIATCVAPLAVAALIGEIAGVRSLVWYSGVSGVLAGASPWIARAARGLQRAQELSPGESRIALLFFLTGALTGALYWLMAAPPAPASEPAASPAHEPRANPRLEPPRRD